MNASAVVGGKIIDARIAGIAKMLSVLTDAGVPVDRMSRELDLLKQGQFIYDWTQQSSSFLIKVVPSAQVFEVRIVKDQQSVEKEKIRITHGDDGYWLQIDAVNGKHACIHLESNASIVSEVLQSVAIEQGSKKEKA